MTNGIQGKRIVLAASRKLEEMSSLIEKQGAIPVIRSLQGTVFSADEQVKEGLKSVVEEKIDWMIFTTGIGTETLIKLADDIGKKETFLGMIGQAQVAARGYKTVGALKKLEVTPDAKDEDGTVKGLVEALKGYEFKGKRVMVQLHGENAPSLVAFLEEAGATVFPLLPYQHTPPERETVELVTKEIIQGEIDAICFTTAIQARALFTYAKETGRIEDLLHSFENQVLAVAVGKVTAEALKEQGLERFIVPERERMGAMIMEVARFYQK